MKRFLWILCFMSLAVQPCQAKEKETAVPALSDRSVLVAWEDGRVPVKKETQGGTLIAWEPGRTARPAAAAPPIPSALLQPYYGARQFDIEETPIGPGRGMLQPPSRVLPAADAFVPIPQNTESAAASSDRKSHSA